MIHGPVEGKGNSSNDRCGHGLATQGSCNLAQPEGPRKGLGAYGILADSHISYLLLMPYVNFLDVGGKT
jgi:hypothetical protein